MHPLLQKLEGKDRRSIGRADEVASDVLNDPGLFHVLAEGLNIENLIVKMRAADAMEKASIEHPEYLLPYKKKLIEIANNSEQKEVRWHMAQILPRLEAVLVTYQFNLHTLFYNYGSWLNQHKQKSLKKPSSYAAWV